MLHCTHFARKQWRRTHLLTSLAKTLRLFPYTRTTTEQKVRGGKEEDFILIAALCSIWLQSVVGDQIQRIYLVRGMTSLVSRVLLLAIVVGLATSGLQHH